jgi:hypothetical protein
VNPPQASPSVIDQATGGLGVATMASLHTISEDSSDVPAVRLIVFNQDMAPFGYSLAERYRIRPLLLQFQPLQTFQGLVKQDAWKMALMDALVVPVRLDFSSAKNLYQALSWWKRMCYFIFCSCLFCLWLYFL